MSDVASLSVAEELLADVALRRRRLPRYGDYTPSDARWLSDIPNHWDIRRLKFVARVNPTKSGINVLGDDDLVSFVPMESIHEFGGMALEETRPIDEVSQGYTYFCDGDIVIAKITPCFENGKGSIAANLVNGIGFGTTELHVIRPRFSVVDKAFLFYLTMSEPFRNLGTGEMYGAGGQKRVPDSFVRDFRTPLPPLDEQEAIARFLDRETAKIDSLVAKKRRLIALLGEKRTALISHAVTKGLNPDAPMKPSGIDWLGDVPAHWEVIPLRRVLTRIEQGWSPECENRVAGDDEWAVMKAGCVNYGRFDEMDHKALPNSLTPDPALEIRPGDLLMSRACGTAELVGSVAYVSACREKLLLCDKLFRLRADESRCQHHFINLFLNSRSAREQIAQKISGADGLANNITQRTVREIVLPVPPGDEQEAICEQVAADTAGVDRLVEMIQTVIGRLNEYRSSLISAAVTGQIDVRNTNVCANAGNDRGAACP